MKTIITDGASAVARVAYKLSQVVPIYPITPSSPMAEFCSGQNAKGEKNIFGQNVKIVEMQSEAGVAGAMHGASLSRALTCSFTSSQGLLLMIPNMFKMAGECLPAVLHVATRAVASHALSIFCDHSDIMATRMTGFIMLASNSVQEAHYMALASHLIALKCRLPVLHFFDGFRTSHQLQKITVFEDSEILPLFENLARDYINSYEDKQFGTAQNPDVFFQNRERNEGNYLSIESALNEVFGQIFTLTGKKFSAFEYVGAENAERVVVSMASSCQTIEEYIRQNPNEKIGLIKVRLYRPFLQNAFLSAMPKSVKCVTVLDRTKENGANAPLYLDVCSTLMGKNITLIGGRYGLGGKEFLPQHIHSIFENMKSATPKNNFTVGIDDDLFGSALPMKQYKQGLNHFGIKIYGLGSDGSVSASKATIKILGENCNKNVQGYFEYDSKKSGSLTTSHIRICNHEILSEYLLENVNLVSINNFSFVGKYDCLKGLKTGGTVVLNTIFSANELNKVLPREFVNILKEKNANFFVIDGQKIARECELGSKINIIMQTALFKCGGLLKEKEIKENIEKYIRSAFAVKGEDVVAKNIKAMEIALGEILKVDVDNLVGVEVMPKEKIENNFYNDVICPISKLEGDKIPLSRFSIDGSAPLGTTEFEKRSIASRLPEWIKENCIQCGKCVLACPHSALSALLTEDAVDGSFANAFGLPNKKYKILLSPEDCTGCGVCANTCPAIKKALSMKGAEKILSQKIDEYRNGLRVCKCEQVLFSDSTAKGIQFKESLFKFPGACAGCGETAYLKLLSMINGSNMMIANATGCSSIYAGTYGSCPYGKDENGGIFWANSLFEDNAEFGLGIKLGNAYTKNKDKNVWIIGGDGWANDIGFGGLDHILASGENVNILVLDNQSYSNTGGQASKATPVGASIKFAEGGKENFKKNLAQIALCYDNVYVAQIAIGASMEQSIKAFKEAQLHTGVSIVIAYCPCINQGFELSDMIGDTANAVKCGFWPIFRYVPCENKLYLDSDIEESKFFDYIKNQRRFAVTLRAGKNHLIEKQKEQAMRDYQFLKDKSEK